MCRVEVEGSSVMLAPTPVELSSEGTGTCRAVSFARAPSAAGRLVTFVVTSTDGRELGRASARLEGR